MSELNSKLQQVVDRMEISELMARYCRAVDRLDLELFRSVFWPGGGYAIGTGRIVASDANDIAEQVLHGTVEKLVAKTQHFISNLRVEFCGETSARTEVYFWAYHRLHSTRESVDGILGADRAHQLGDHYNRQYDAIVGGRYVDDLEKRSGEWRIQTRRIVSDWTASGAASDFGKEPNCVVALMGLMGSRDRSDPSYAS
jgi:SnoaL-like domain